MSEERDTKIVELAVQAAGVADDTWHNRVVALVPKVAAVFREGRDEKDPMALVNIARKVTESHGFRAEYRGHELDDTTQRLFVKFYDENGQDGDYLDENGCQTLRTEPMWSPSGRAMRAILERMKHGQPANVYRYSEAVSKTQKTALLTHIEPLRMPRGGNQTRPAPDPARSSDRQAEGGARQPSSAALPATDDVREQLARLQNSWDELTNPQKVAYARACRENGIDNPVEPPMGRLDDAERLMAEARTK